MFGHPKPKEYNTIDVEGKIFSLLKKNTDENEEEYKKRISKSRILETLSKESIQKEIENWKNKKRQEKTRDRRPDLWEKYNKLENGKNNYE